MKKEELNMNEEILKKENYKEYRKKYLKEYHKEYYKSHKDDYKNYRNEYKEHYREYYRNYYRKNGNKTIKKYNGLYVYIITDLNLNKDVYVGSTTNLYSRILLHRSKQKIKELNDKGHNYLVKYIKISDYLNLEIKELRELEQYFIDNYLDDDNLNFNKAIKKEVDIDKIKEWINIYMNKRRKEGKEFFDIFTKLNPALENQLN